MNIDKQQKSIISSFFRFTFQINLCFIIFPKYPKNTFENLLFIFSF
jgi:hypothetical protein